jgi:hypothetical protein
MRPELAKILEVDEKRIRAIWGQADVPVILRRGEKGEKLRVRLCKHEYAEKDTYWLKKARRLHPIWNNHWNCWEVPKAWFDDLVSEFINTYGKLYVVQPYREQMKCAPACQNAQGLECECSCMGELHGAQNIESGWFVVSDTFATMWGKSTLACRLIERN